MNLNLHSDFTRCLACASVTLMVASGVSQILPADCTFSVFSDAQADERVQIVSINPGEGATVEALNDFEIELSGAIDADFGYGSEKTLITLTDETGEVVSNGSLRDYSSGVIIRLTPEVTVPGDYTLTFKEGAICANDWGDKGPEMVTGTGCEEYVFHYTIAPANTVVDFLGANPENGSTVSYLETIVTEWSLPAGSYGLEATDASSMAFVKDGEGTFVSYATIKIADEGVLITLENPIKTNGEFTVTIISGAIWATDAEGMIIPYTDNPTVTLNYTVDINSDVAINDAMKFSITADHNGIEATGFNAPLIEVFDMAGNCLALEKSDRVSVELVKGLYIVKASDNDRSIVRRVFVK